MITLSTPIIGKGGTVREVLDCIYPNGLAPQVVIDYLDELKRLCDLVGLDFRILAAQSAHETANWTSSWWRTRRNPAGIGITGDPAQNAASYTWANGTDAARGHVVHMYYYADTGSFSEVDRTINLNVLDRYLHLDPRIVALSDSGFMETVRVLGDLGNGKWAADPNYATQIAAKANLIFKQTSPAKGDTSVVDLVRIEQQLIGRNRPNRPGTKLLLTYGTPHQSVHETANNSVGAGAQAHADLVCGDWGAQSYVSVHLWTDDKVCKQTLPLDEMGYHAGDGCNDPATDTGCFRSIAMEICVNADADQAKAYDNAAQVFARVILQDDAFDWGGGSTKGKFDANHFDQHIWISQEVPPHDCPQGLRHDYDPPWTWQHFMDRIDYWLEVLGQPQPTKPGNGEDSPVPGIRLPEGIDIHFLERRFANRSNHVIVLDGNRYSFNPDGTVSRAWLRHCKDMVKGKRNKKNYRWWPSLVKVEQIDKKHRRFTFKDGWAYVSPPLDIKPKRQA